MQSIGIIGTEAKSASENTKDTESNVVSTPSNITNTDEVTDKWNYGI